MQEGFFTSLKRWVLWDFPRGSLQYDVMVGLILAFIFLTPARLFRDQPKPKDVVMIPGDNGNAVFWIDPGLLSHVPEEKHLSLAQDLVRTKARNREFEITRLEPIFDSEEEIRGFMALAKPSD
jgi:hypothetical protein